MIASFAQFQEQLKTNPNSALVANINIDRNLISEARDANAYVFIGKTSKWGGPFQVAWDGDQQEIVEKYRDWVKSQPKLLADLPSLRGKVLGCYCAPRPCHGDVLIELLQEATSQ